MSDKEKRKEALEKAREAKRKKRTNSTHAKINLKEGQ